MTAEKRLINPWRLWFGAFVPEWLMQRSEPSPGAKLAYARLCRFAGKQGVARPFLSDLGEELGVGERQARRYVAELAKCDLVEIERRGHGESNLYRFPAHEWMNLTGEELDTPDTSVRSRADTSVPSRADMDDRSRADTSDRSERTHPTAHERTDPSVPFLRESVVENQQESHRGAGLAADASELEVALVGALGHAPATKSERGAWRNAVNQLDQADATPDEVRSRSTEYRRRWPDATLTASALARHWGELGASNVTPLRAPSTKRVECEACDSIGFVTTGPGAVTECPQCNRPAAGARS